VVEEPNPVEAVDEVEEEVAVLAACDVEAVPGIVDALTAPSSPTPARAPRAAPVVSRLSKRYAASRARILSWVLVSMARVSTPPLKRP
jgi:hypothetical protein